MTFIDWALAKFLQYGKNKQDFEISYAMNHVAIMSKMQTDILEHVANKQQLNLDDLERTVFHRRQRIKLADVAWAFKMYTKASHGKAVDKPEVYKKVFDTRIQEYKEEFI